MMEGATGKVWGGETHHGGWSTRGVNERRLDGGSRQRGSSDERRWTSGGLAT
jgi:hypothetical protein